MWTENLERILGAATEEDRNFAYVNATARELFNPVDPLYSNASTGLSDFDGQVAAFEQRYGSFTANDLVTVNFGGNDLTVLGATPTSETVTQTVNAIVAGMEELSDLGARHFLVTNLPDLTYAPFLSNPEAAAAVGIDAVLLDTLVVRTLLVPALAILLGERFGWPRS